MNKFFNVLKMKQEDILLDRLSNTTNRSLAQTRFLFDLLSGDIIKLIKLEENIKNLFISYCPGDKKTCNKILKAKVNKEIWAINFSLKQL
jgi:hypothetical protein